MQVYFLLRFYMNDSSSSSVPFKIKNKSSIYRKYVIALSLMYGKILVNSNFPIKMFTYDDEQMALIAQYFIWR